MLGVPGIFSSQKTFQSEAAWEDQIFQGLAKKLSQPWLKQPFSNWWEHHRGMAGNFAGVSFPIEDGSIMPAIASMCYFTTRKKFQLLHTWLVMMTQKSIMPEGREAFQVGW